MRQLTMQYFIDTLNSHQLQTSWWNFNMFDLQIIPLKIFLINYSTKYSNHDAV